MTAKIYQPDPEFEQRVKKATERISENMHIVANEPSLAFYRLQEHVRKALPPMVEKRVEVLALKRQLQGRCYDVEYAVSAVKTMQKAEKNFSNTIEYLKTGIHFKQQLKFEEQRRNKKDGQKDSMYKRLSAHITTLDYLPDEISDVVRETANKVESMMNHARHSNSNELQRANTTNN
ncbi:BLOC-1-related complex subunit 8 homolog [Microplitis mediator]|uniref:BLOC-1-related complex subunit 8 homolog n=1 Tax=Microplitis mediator TaxID=375433 RepID=UPI0025564BD1|nr:BLOC-1-related complex subunit 8 homolog [Microplitis mediator]XP_057324534.1 BLOC-1-related complex subunit 8 homolog [Microplitis mediator]